MKLTLLGTGTPGANPQRRGPSQVIESGGELVLIDCGATVAHRLVEAGYARRPIRQLAITHLHSDHITGLADLLWAGWVGRWWDRAPQIAGPPGTKEFVEYLIKAYSYDIAVRTLTPGGEGLLREWLVPEVLEIEEGWQSSGSDWQIAAFTVDHVQVKDAFGFRMDGPGGSIVISGDTRRSENLIEQSQGADLLVHEVIRIPPTTISDPFAAARWEAVNAYHTASTEVGKIATDAGAKHLVLSHLVIREGTPEDLRSDIEPDYKGPLTVGEDLMTFELDEGRRSF
jgi:ribonuclease Z